MQARGLWGQQGWVGSTTTAPLPPAVSSAKPVQSGFWEYLSQLTGDKDSLEHGQSKLGRDIA